MKIKVYCLLFLCSYSFSNAQQSAIETNTSEKTVTMSQSLYFDNEDKPFLGTVTRVDNSKQQLLLYGYAPKSKSSYDSYFTAQYRKMGNEFYLVKLNRTRDMTFIISDWKSPLKFLQSISVTTIPFKVRTGNEQLERITTSGLKNLALNFDFFSYNRHYYFHSGKNLKFRVALGGFISPTVEEIEVEGTGSDSETANELFLSAGFSINLGFNDIGFSFIPFGWDQATTSMGKNWKYNGRRWWGFGIGLSPKFLNPKG